jgi:cation:H+ antiporter
MLLQFVLFAIGLAILYLGADWLVRGASSLALHFGIRPLVVGLTVVALGTSMPEFLLNLFAVFAEEDSLAIGNIIGSNIANIALILGLTSVLLPLAVDRGTIRKEYPMMLGVTLLFWALASDGVVSRLDGAVLVFGLASFLVWLVVDARNHARHNGDRRPTDEGATSHMEDHGTSDMVQKAVLGRTGRIVYIVGGVLALGVGARFMVTSAVEIADALNVHHVVIGLTIVAIGTSLPELAASMVCVIRKEADMSVGNVLGSNLLNILFVVGLIALFRPLTVEPVALQVHFPVMVVFTALLFPLAWTRFRISRPEGVALLALYAVYLGYLAAPYL